jgi:hypothetical protein
VGSNPAVPTVLFVVGEPRPIVHRSGGIRLCEAISEGFGSAGAVLFPMDDTGGRCSVVRRWIETSRDRRRAKMCATGIARRYTDAAFAAERAASSVHTERLAIIVELALAHRFPVTPERRTELDIIDGALQLEAVAYRYAADRAADAAAVVRTAEFRQWMLDNPAARVLSDAAALAAFCSSHPGHPGVLTLHVRMDRLPVR